MRQINKNIFNQKNFKRLSFVITTAGLILIFQNCGQGFKSLDLKSGVEIPSNSSPTPTTPPTPTPTAAPTPTATPTQIPSPTPTPLPGDGKYVTQEFSGPFALVYVRIPRTVGGATQANGTTPSKAINGQFDAFPETSHWVSGMSGPGQLVYRDRTGKETIIFDCIGKSFTPIVMGSPDPGGPRECLPMDPTVSFDGKKVIFSVLYTSFVKSTYQVQTYAANGATMTKVATDSVGAQLFEADLTTFTYRPLEYRKLGDFDTAPVYIPWDETNPNDKDRIMFTSNRSRELPSAMISGAAGRAFNKTLLQLYIGDGDGKNVRRVGVHDRDGILHPFVMSDGRVLFTTWSLSHMGAYRKNNGSVRNHASPQNESWLASVDSKGGFFVADYGRHAKGRTAGCCTEVSSVGLHFVTESSDRKWICSDDYYRANNMGGGITTCYQREPVGVEGAYPTTQASAAFMPRYFFKPFTFGSNSDNNSDTGGTRDPMALPGNQLMVTWLKGNACLRADIALYTYPENSCDTGIYRTVSMPTAASGLQKIVDDPSYHEFMARVAEPYQFVYGLAKPQFAGHQQNAPNGKCYLGSSSMEGEVQPLTPYSFNSKGLSSHDCAVQGCKARAIDTSQVKAIRFWEVLSHDTNFLHTAPEYADSGQPNLLKSLTGHRLKLLGDAPLKSDGSFIAEIPCETPYLMAGVSGDGEVIMRDQIPQSLRKGEVRTCTGCHLHSPKEGRPFNQSISGSDLNKHFQNVSSAGISLVGAPGGYKEIWKGAMTSQLTVNSSGITSPVTDGQIYEYKQHIVPILNSSCVSCHNGSIPLDLRENFVTSTFFATSAAGHEQNVYWPTELWNTITNRKPADGGDWEIPRLSKYMHMGFAVESLFYWKTAGKRLDGRTDGTESTDLDYGPVSSSDPHANIKPEHARIIKNWLDSGAYLHQGNLPVNYKPTGY